MRAPPEASLLDAATFRKASYSSPDNGCVEIARPSAPIVGIRDSKAPGSGRLVITPAAFDAFLARVRS